MEKIKLALVDDDYLIVTLLKSFFNQDQSTQVVYDTTDGYQLFNYLEEKNNERIDILLLDLKMKTIDGLEVLKHVKTNHPELKVVVVSSHYQDNSIGFMTKEGVAGFLPKGMSPFELLDIVKQVHKNGFYLNKDQMEILREQISSKVSKPMLDEDELLTDREKEIIKLLCQQKTAKEIGEHLFITQRTVEGHKNNLFTKIGVRNVAGLIVYALQKHIVTLEELSLN
ncbi:DNA-binding response regulator, NarL/FixJ family, contains REC and HTH domains [Paenimyroides ummariense]|uniref:DNA-binding response regulator, NarL/FixJ family, contains REC and HTH domains n=1 Tax=Paenimyroides ummariense TaxID=913024 RepID=A0A1I5BSF8_9FLAO|nr:response regulator transcription factor [Paenimyroides ummariense]SFN77646.1 DNA-binding response regulator, NarL/FixJ family, contains REC and HTH domains [Paenimyroides ummariense]